MDRTRTEGAAPRRPLASLRETRFTNIDLTLLAGAMVMAVMVGVLSFVSALWL
jgi:hypothetical protein